MSEPEDWALDRASELFEAEFPVGPPFVGVQWRYAFAKYITQHEQAPVDPLLIEAREIAAAQWDATRIRVENFGRASEIRKGNHDDAQDVRCALAALKRGMELAKS